MKVKVKCPLFNGQCYGSCERAKIDTECINGIIETEANLVIDEEKVKKVIRKTGDCDFWLSPSLIDNLAHAICQAKDIIKVKGE